METEENSEIEAEGSLRDAWERDLQAVQVDLPDNSHPTLSKVETIFRLFDKTEG